MRFCHQIAAGLRYALRVAIGAALLIQLVPSGQAHAELPYATWTVDSDQSWIAAPSAYVPSGVWKGFNNPEDLFITREDEIFVADTGNNQIVQLNKQGEVLRVFPDPEEADQGRLLQRPEGVFVTEAGDVYVADTGNMRIVMYDVNGQFRREILTPDSSLIPSTFVYMPSKVIVDQRGYIYIAVKGGYQGLLQLTDEGDFAGFYGANKVAFSWIESLKRKFYTEEQLKEEQMRLPGSITNMAVDQQGFIYTVNKDMPSGQLRRLNFGGIDLLKNRDFAPWAGPLEPFSFRDVHVSDEGILTVIEEAGGKIYQYDKFGEMIFAFGNKFAASERQGLFKRPASVIADSTGSIYVSDAELNLIQKFDRTDYGEAVHQAIDLDSQGKYEAARALWKRIIAYNGMYERAYLGIARAQYQAGEYEAARDNYKHAADKPGYSNAFWQIRMDWLQQYFGLIMTGLCVIAAGVAMINKRRKPQAGTKREGARALPGRILRQLAEMLRHPIKGMYAVSEREQVRWVDSLMLIIAGFAINIAGKYAVGYLFARQPFEELQWQLEAAIYFLPWLSWVCANYLTGSVMKGEGSFKKIFAVSSYVLLPYVLFMLPVQWVSNALTLQEAIFYQAAVTGIGCWVVLLLFIGTMAVHNYNAKEAIGMVTVSIATLACIWVFMFVLIGLFYQAADFFTELGREVIGRV